MILQVLHCPHCHGTAIVRHGQTRQGKQRYRGRAYRCAGRTFLLDYSYPGQSPAVKEQSVEMALNARGIRDPARVLHVSTNTVLKELRKRDLHSSTCTSHCDRSCSPSRWRWRAAAPRNWSDGADAPQSATRCGRMSRRNRSRVGCGTLLSITRARYGPRHLDAARRTSSSSSNSCWHRWASRSFPPTAGGLTSGIAMPSSIRWARSTRRKSRANLSICGPGASGSSAARCASPRRSACTIS
jgi:transposase-like protein